LLHIEEVTAYKNLFKEIELPALLLSVKKNDAFDIENVIDQILNIEGISGFQFILFFNEGADLDDLFTLMWLLGGNLEPDRDIQVKKVKIGEKIIFVDSTFKTLKNDNFKRNWPNVVTMDNKTIKAIDEKWESLNLGDLIESPSLKFKSLIIGDGAVRRED